MNAREITRLLGISRPTLNEWIATKGLPVKRRGGRGRDFLFDPPKVIKWYTQFLGQAPQQDTTIIEATRRKVLAEAELKELELAKSRGEVIAVTVVEKQLFTMGRTIRDHLLNLPDRLSGPLAAEADQQKVHALLEGEIAQGLTGLSKALQKRRDHRNGRARVALRDRMGQHHPKSGPRAAQSGIHASLRRDRAHAAAAGS